MVGLGWFKTNQQGPALTCRPSSNHQTSARLADLTREPGSGCGSFVCRLCTQTHPGIPHSPPPIPPNHRNRCHTSRRRRRRRWSRGRRPLTVGGGSITRCNSTSSSAIVQMVHRASSSGGRPPSGSHHHHHHHHHNNGGGKTGAASAAAAAAEASVSEADLYGACRPVGDFQKLGQIGEVCMHVHARVRDCDGGIGWIDI